MEKKMTKVEKIQHIMAIPAVQVDEIAMEYLNKELELLTKRKDGGNGEKAKEKKAVIEGLKSEILEVLTTTENGLTATEITKAIKSDVTTQRVVSVIRKLIEDDNMVERIMVKKTAYFTLKEKVENGEN